jgi:DNA repair protein SbcC/Rad50
MIPTRLALSNFMSYRADAGDAPALDFSGLHVVVLSGENGAGKSTLLDAITWALWGQARMADDDLIAQGAGEMWVELEFLLGEQCYRVRRARQRGGTGKRGGQTAGKSQLDLQAQDGAGWRALSELTIRETQERIDDLLRMSYQTFINASFLLQGRADEFTARTPTERKKVLAEILDLGEYDQLEAKAKERAKGFDDRLRGLRGEMQSLREAAAQRDFWAGQVNEAEANVERLRAEVERAEAERAAAEQRRVELERRADGRKELLRRLDELRAGQRQRETEIAALREQIARAAALLDRRAQIAAGMAALAAARAELERLDGLRDRHEELQRRREELSALFKEARNELRQQLSSAEARLEALAARAARRDALAAELDGLAAALEALAPLAQEQAARVEEAAALGVRLAQLDELGRRRDSLAATITLRKDSLVAAREQRREAVARLDGQLAEAGRWRADLDAARLDQRALVAGEAELVALRAREQADLDAVSDRRAACQSAKGAAEKLKQNQQLLDSGAGACPICGSELGESGLAEVHRHYESELAALRAAYAAARKDADEGDARLRATRDAIAAGEQSVGALRRSAARVEPLERQLAQAAAWQLEADTLRAEYAGLRAQIEREEFEPGAQAELAALLEELAPLGDQAELAQQRQIVEERVRELDRRLQERGQLAGRREAYAEEQRRIEADLAALPALTAEAAELRRVIDANDFAHAVRDEGQALRAQIEALGYTAEAHSAAREQARELRRWEEDDRALAVAEQGYSRDTTILAQAEALQTRDAAESVRLEREDAALAEELRELPRALARADEAAAALRGRQQILQVAQKELGEKQAYLRGAQSAADTLARREEDERALAERHGLYVELAEAFGKKGVQAMLIDTAIPQIEDEANRLLGRMTDGQMHLSLDTQRDTKKGDTVETLEIRIADPLGTRAYDAFSGGEAMRVNFAVRIALSRLLARRAGARLETLVIDEGFGTLDALGRERMVEAITSVQDDFKRIIVITHLDELKDRFPATIEVTKTPAGSRWEIR